MENLRNKRWGVPVSVIGGFALGVAVTLGVQAAQGPSEAERAEHAYERLYTDPGRCLSGTPYDPAQGAFIGATYDSRNGEEIVKDLPFDADEYKPSVLSFTVTSSNEVRPSDQQTEAFLDAHCAPQVLPQT